MKSNDKKGYILSFLAILLATIWIFAAVFSFINNLSIIEANSTNEDLATVADCNAAETRAIFERYFSTLAAVGKSVERYDRFVSKAVMTLLQEIVEQDEFSSLSIDKDTGVSHNSDGTVNNIEELYSAERIADGIPFILDVAYSYTTESNEINLIVPLKDGNGRYSSALRGTISVDVLSIVFEKTFAKSGGYYHVVDGNGKYVSTGNSKDELLMEENYFDAIEKLTYKSGFSIAQITEAFSKQKSGYSQYSYEAEERYAYYAPINVNNWMILMVVPKAVVEETAHTYMLNSIWLMSQIVVVLLFFIFYVYFIQKKARDVARLNEKCFKVLTEQNSKAIFEWDYDNNRIHYLSDFKGMFGSEAPIFDNAELAISSKIVHKDDKEMLDKMFAAIRTANSASNMKFRVANSEGVYCWCEVSVTFVKRQNGKPYKAVGFIENIDERVKKEEQLLKRSEIDQLTGVYNKSTTEYMIETILSEADASKDKHALIVIDIDNYKDVNDELGHLYGDIVLAQLAATLKSIFRADDVVGRLGGDEFFVFVKNYGVSKILTDRASSVCEKLHKTFSEGNASVTISASVGIAIFPEHGTEFETLYKASDIALYNVKASGKNGYRIYDGLRMQHYISNRTVIDTSGGQQKNFYGNKLEYLFKLLYDSENNKLAVSSVLKLVAEQFGLCRANVFEIDSDGSTFSCIYEWCEINTPSIREQQQKIPIETNYHLSELLKSGEGISERSVDELPRSERGVFEKIGVKTLITFAITSGEGLVGNIVFQNTSEDYITLSANELNEIKTTCQVLATFLLKQRSAEQEKQYRYSIETILNTAEGLVYVIDRENWHVIFENKQIRDVTSKVSVGGVCYKIYSDRDEPCENCPILAIKDGENKAIVEIHNKMYDIYSKTTGTRINWIDDRKAYLISSIDISEYRRKNPIATDKDYMI